MYCFGQERPKFGVYFFFLFKTWKDIFLKHNLWGRFLLQPFFLSPWGELLYFSFLLLRHLWGSLISSAYRDFH